MNYKYYLHPLTKKHIVFTSCKEGFYVYNVHDENDRPVAMHRTDGTSDLESYDFIEVGRLIEIHNRVLTGKQEYDPYILWASFKKEKINNNT